MLDRGSDIPNKYQYNCEDYALLHQKTKPRKHAR